MKQKLKQIGLAILQGVASVAVLILIIYFYIESMLYLYKTTGVNPGIITIYGVLLFWCSYGFYLWNKTRVKKDENNNSTEN